MDGILMRTTTRLLIAAFLALAAMASPACAQFTEQRVYAGTAGGSANAQTITIANMPAVVPQGVPLRWLPVAPNTTTATLTVSGGSGAIALCKPSPAGPTALTGGELQTTQTVETLYNGTCHLIVSSVDSTASSIFVQPQGRLTLSTGVPVMTGDVSGATSMFYAPYSGNQVPIWNGSRFVVFQFAQITITIPSSRLANLIYDVCAFNSSGSLAVGIGPAWSNSSAGAGSRGTGAGTAELARVGGLLTNAVTVSVVNGATTTSVGANLCTYLGSILIDGTNGQVSALFTYGTSRKVGIWNAYNRVPVTMKAGPATANWTYASTTIRAANNDSTNSLSVFTGLQEEPFELVLHESPIGNNNVASSVGIGWNSTTVYSGTNGDFGSSGAQSAKQTTLARFIQTPQLGANTVTALESGSASGTTTYNGTEAFFALTATYRY